jgi:hypothetical protein
MLLGENGGNGFSEDMSDVSPAFPKCYKVEGLIFGLVFRHQSKDGFLKWLLLIQLAQR